jgi:hypothetical protein
VLDKNGVGGTLTQPTESTAHELRTLQNARSALRELPRHVVEERYVNAVIRGDDPQFVKVVESAGQLPLVRAHAREQARQIRVQNYSAATRITDTKKGLDLRSVSHGHAVRAIEEYIVTLKIRSDTE